MRTRSDGDFRAQAVERPFGPLLSLASRHTNRSQANVRVPRDGRGQPFHRVARALGTNEKDDVARAEIRTLAPFAARRSFRNDIGLFEQLFPSSVR